MSDESTPVAVKIEVTFGDGTTQTLSLSQLDAGSFHLKMTAEMPKSGEAPRWASFPGGPWATVELVASGKRPAPSSVEGL